MRAAAVSVVVLCGVLLAGCGPDSGSGASRTSSSGPATTTAAVRPTLTDPKLQPPVQDNKYTRSTGRPAVVFDPCTWITDADVESVGFRASSRKRGADLVAEYTFLTCDFRSTDYKLSLGLDSGNITWDENLRKNSGWLQGTEVNGRRAGFGKGEADRAEDCQVHLETKVGVVFVRTMAADKTVDPCASIMNIASVVEKSIGKDN